MNYYAFIPLVAFIVNLFTWTYIYAQRRKSPVNRTYLIFTTFVAGWTIAVFIIWLPIKEALILPTLKIGSIAWLMIGFGFLNFTYTFLEKRKDYVYYAYLASSITSVMLSVLTDLYMDGYTKHYWGVNPRGVLYIPITSAVTVSPFFYAFFLIYKSIKIAKNNNTRKQLSLIVQGTVIGCSIAFIAQIIFPYILKMEIVHIGSLGVVIQALFIFQAINKYNFLSISTEEVANDLFTNVQDGVILADTNERIIQINEAAKKLFNRRISETQNLRVSDLFENYDFQENYKNYETKIIGNIDEKIVSLSQAAIKQSNMELGKILIVRDITESKKAERELKDSKAKLERLAGELVQANASLEQKVAERTRSLLISNEQLQREIVERTRAEEALAAEKERLAVTLESIGDGVITTDTAGSIVLLNKVAEQLTGWPQAEAVGQPLATVFPIVDEKTRGPCENPVEEVLHTNDVVSRTHHTILRARDQAERLVAESAAPIHTQDGKVIGVVLVFRDMTERRRIEEELIKADKLESIGVLAGGIAHDFNNILTAIMGNISLAKMYASPEDKVYTRLSNAEKASLQAQNLTQQLLTFSKGGSPVRKPSSIVDLIRDAIDFSLRGSNVRCELFIENNIWPVEIDGGQISQVVNNLIINADQAMPEGGMIEVRVGNVTVEDRNIEPFLPLQKGKYVEISVKDHGVGIPEEHLQKIFDPYFTTKKQGSGLGLFTCYSIVKKHDGHIAVESYRDIGTTFYIYIPASQRQALKQERKVQVHHPGQGKILIMEDEENIRDVTGEMLRHFGYEVAFARDGTEAIELYKGAQDAGKPFDVIIMDLTIPGGMGGKEAIRKILDIDPQAKAVVASGYANDPIIAAFRQHGFCDRIAKPYKSEELHEILQRIMTGTGA